MEDETRLEISCGPSAGRGVRPIVTARLGDQMLYCDRIDPVRADDRRRFCQALCQGRPGIDRDAVAQQLQRLADQVTADRGAGAAGAPACPGERYRVVDGRICRLVNPRDGDPVPVPLCNFAAAIVEEVERHDGVERAFRLALRGTLASGEELPTVEVSATEFHRGDWPLTCWGTRAVVLAGQGTRDQLRCALQMLSGDVRRRTVRTHTGWCPIDHNWVYLHAGGAIGPDGSRADVEVDLPEALAGYRLPDPPAGEDLRCAVRASLGLARGLAPDRVALPLLATTYRAVLPAADFGTHLTGRTGAFKTELAALMQQHFGPGLHARNLPASWSSTGNALEAIAFAAKEALLVVDDFAPAGTPADVQRYHREAERLLRAQGNRSGRQRMRADGRLQKDRPPRGLILSTGEDVSRGHSIRARLLIVEVGPEDVDADRLTACQREAAAGVYAAALAGFVRWLAGRYERSVAGLRAEVERLRDEIAAETGPCPHRRTPTLIADLLVGFRLLLEFAAEVGALGAAEGDSLGRRCRAALMEIAGRQAAHQEEADPCGRYLQLLRSLLGQGRAHLAAPDGGRPAIAPQACGWRPPGRPDEFGAPWTPLGRCLGWLDGDDLYVDPDAAFAEVQRLASDQGEALPVTQGTLHKRLKERGLLAGTEAGRERLQVRRTLAGSRRPVLHLRAGLVLSLEETGPTGPTDPGAEEGPAMEAVRGGRPAGGRVDGHLPAAVGGVGGPVGPVSGAGSRPGDPDPGWEVGEL